MEKLKSALDRLYGGKELSVSSSFPPGDLFQYLTIVELLK